jgi:hypothetical protein
MATVIKVLRVFVGFAVLGYGLFVIFVSKPAFSRGDNELAIRLVAAAIVLVLIAIVLRMPDAKRLTRRDRTIFLVAALLMSHGGYWVFAMAQASTQTVVDYMIWLFLMSFAGVLSIFWFDKLHGK